MTLRELADPAERSQGPDERLDSAICCLVFPFINHGGHPHLRFTEWLREAALLVPWRLRWRVGSYPETKRAPA